MKFIFRFDTSFDSFRDFVNSRHNIFTHLGIVSLFEYYSGIVGHSGYVPIRHKDLEKWECFTGEDRIEECCRYFGIPFSGEILEVYDRMRDELEMLLFEDEIMAKPLC